MLVLVLMAGLGQWGCMFLGGAAVGLREPEQLMSEYSAHQQMEKLEANYRAERISPNEYEAREKQIEAGSIIY